MALDLFLVATNTQTPNIKIRRIFQFFSTLCTEAAPYLISYQHSVWVSSLNLLGRCSLLTPNSHFPPQQNLEETEHGRPTCLSTSGSSSSRRCWHSVGRTENVCLLISARRLVFTRMESGVSTSISAHFVLFSCPATNHQDVSNTVPERGFQAPFGVHCPQDFQNAASVIHFIP